MCRFKLRRFLLLAFLVSACQQLQPPPPKGPPGDLPPSPQQAALGQLQVFITDQMTDGRNLKLRGRVRNPYPDPVDGVRIICHILSEPGPNARELDRFETQTEDHLEPGAQAPLRFDVQTMYAGASWSGFRLEAFAVKRGNESMPVPAGWRG